MNSSRCFASRRRSHLRFGLGVVSLFLTASTVAKDDGATRYDLPATPKTVQWGHYDASSAPALRIRSGDTVVFHTVLTNSPAGLEKAGVKPEDVERSLREIFDGVPLSERPQTDPE